MKQKNPKISRQIPYVTDTTFNSGLTVREQNGKVVYKFGEELKGQKTMSDSYR